jgi:hypothetical protein
MTPDPENLAYLRHELRTPLKHVLAYSEMLLEDPEEARELAAVLRLVRGGARTLLVLIEEALSPACLEGAARTWTTSPPCWRARSTGSSVPWTGSRRWPARATRAPWRPTPSGSRAPGRGCGR